MRFSAMATGICTPTARFSHAETLVHLMQLAWGSCCDSCASGHTSALLIPSVVEVGKFRDIHQPVLMKLRESSLQIIEAPDSGRQEHRIIEYTNTGQEATPMEHMSTDNTATGLWCKASDAQRSKGYRRCMMIWTQQRIRHEHKHNSQENLRALHEHGRAQGA
jgi:hypothetical protein